MSEAMPSEKKQGNKYEGGQRVLIFKSHLLLFIGSLVHFKRCWAKQLCRPEVVGGQGQTSWVYGRKDRGVEILIRRTEWEKKVWKAEQQESSSLWDWEICLRGQTAASYNLLTWKIATNPSSKSFLSDHKASSCIHVCTWDGRCIGFYQCLSLTFTLKLWIMHSRLPHMKDSCFGSVSSESVIGFLTSFTVDIIKNMVWQVSGAISITLRIRHGQIKQKLLEFSKRR